MRAESLFELLTIALMLFVAGLQARGGLFGALMLCFNVLIAGILAFNFWEPLARGLGTHAPRLDAYADALWLTALFTLFLILLRLLTTHLAPRQLALPRRLQQLGGAAVGMFTGYLVAGLIICVLQTLPLPERILGYNPETGSAIGAPERTWLAIVHRATGVVLDEPGDDERWFDADGTVVASSESGPGWGVYVKIAHNIGGTSVTSLYAHMDWGTRRVSVGEKVSAGQLIGQVGDTGRANGTHLHLEIRVNGGYANAESWLQANAG